MNKLYCILTLFILSCLALPSFSREEASNTLVCSYITAGTDFHVQLQPMTFKENGDVYSGKKKIGEIIKADKDEISASLENGSHFFIDKEKYLSIYSLLVDGKPVYNYGSCYPDNKK